VSRFPPPAEPLPTPSSIPDPGPTSLTMNRLNHPVKSSPDLDSTYRITKDTLYDTISGPKGDFSIPTLEELGIPPDSATTPHRGGETQALLNLSTFLSDAQRTAQFSKPNTSPGTFLPPSTTLLSPHLHFGTLSVRKFYYDVRKVVSEFKGKPTTPPTSLEGQLLFREMYIIAHFGVPHYEQTRGNPYCHYMDWNMSNQYDASGNFTGIQKSGNVDGDEQVAEWFTKWKEGRTGYPWIDALMRQLKQDGWIHQYIPLLPI
jgi:cryptochrome